MSEAPPEAPYGVLLHRQLRAVHQMLRDDLALCRQLASDVADGAPAGVVVEAVRSLQSRSPLWELRVNCLYHCRIVHMHHGIEDSDMFPALRRSNPALGAVVDRLEADHRAISALLDEVEASVELLDETSGVARTRLEAALTHLADDLLAHLAYEEEAVSSTMRSWKRWPD